jgi:alpha-tubulin suppressor-like RCC1 family protein
MSSSTPAQIPGLTWKQLSVGGIHSCGIDSTGKLLCWGDNTFFECGKAPNAAGKTFVDVPTDAFQNPAYVAKHVAAGGDVGAGMTCFLDASSNAFCFGSNSLDALGGCQPGSDSGKLTSSKSPIAVCATIPGQPEVDGVYPTYSLAGATRIYAGDLYGCLVVPKSGIYCWGGNNDGQLGNGSSVLSQTGVLSTALLDSNAASQTPDQPLFLGSVGSDTCVIGSFGELECVGYNNNGEAGDGSTSQGNTSLHSPTGLGTVTSVGIGTSTVCAVHAGALFCWGDNTHGQVGTGMVTAMPLEFPTPVSW